MDVAEVNNTWILHIMVCMCIRLISAVGLGLGLQTSETIKEQQLKIVYPKEILKNESIIQQFAEDIPFMNNLSH